MHLHSGCSQSSRYSSLRSSWCKLRYFRSVGPFTLAAVTTPPGQEGWLRGQEDRVASLTPRRRGGGFRESLEQLGHGAPSLDVPPLLSRKGRWLLPSLKDSTTY